MGERNRSINKHQQLVVSIDKLRVNLPEAVTLFRSYMASHDPYRDVSIVEAARATSAAPVGTGFGPVAFVAFGLRLGHEAGGLRPPLATPAPTSLACPHAEE